MQESHTIEIQYLLIFQSIVSAVYAALARFGWLRIGTGKTPSNQATNQVCDDFSLRH